MTPRECNTEESQLPREGYDRESFTNKNDHEYSTKIESLLTISVVIRERKSKSTYCIFLSYIKFHNFLYIYHFI